MSTANSIWTSASGYGKGRSVKTAPIKILEDNDVFYSDDETKVPIKSKGRGLALSDSSNNVTRKVLPGKSNQSSNDFVFKKPMSRVGPGKAKVEKTFSLEFELSTDTVIKPRSQSVPSAWHEDPTCNDALSLQELHREDGNLYPETECLRDVQENDTKELSGSPIQRVMDEGIPEFLNESLLTEDEAAMNFRSEEVEEDDLSDESYPELERFPQDYANRIFYQEFENARGAFPHWERSQAVRGDTDEPESSDFDFKLDFSFEYIGQDDRCLSPAIYDEDILSPPPCRFVSDEEETASIR